MHFRLKKVKYPATKHSSVTLKYELMPHFDLYDVDRYTLLNSM